MCGKTSRPPETPAPSPGGLLFLATWGGTGFLPWCPGTWGTLAALPLWWLLTALGQVLYAAFLGLLLLLGVKAAEEAQRLLARTDHPAIVIDEAAGLLVALAGMPPEWSWMLAGTGLFRLFDILKPWPIRALGEGNTGLEVMLDDVLAGILARLAAEILGCFWSG